MRLNVHHLAAGALVLGLCLSPGVTDAQQVPIVPGTRARVTVASLVTPLVANFLEQRQDSLVFIEEGTGRGVWTFSLAQIEKLETSGGQVTRNRKPVAKGVAIGAGAGLVAGLMFAAAARPSEDGRTYNRPLTGLAGAAAGAVIGLWIGSRQPAERWLNVPLPGRLSLAPGLGGFRIGFSFR